MKNLFAAIIVVLFTFMIVFQACKKNETNLPPVLAPNSISLKEVQTQYNLAKNIGLPSKIDGIELNPDWTRSE